MMDDDVATTPQSASAWSSIRQAQEFANAAKTLTGMADLHATLSEVVTSLGFDGVAMLHHVDFTAGGAPVIAYADYPMDFLSKVLGRRYFADDPVLAACQRTAAPFSWCELPELISLTARQREILAQAANCGLQQGFTVPINVPGEPLGSCSFARRSGRVVPEEVRQAALWVGVFAFEQARRILGLARPTAARPRLSPRQFDCVVLAARGNSDWVIGRLLGLSKDTVHEYIEAAKQRYGVATRQQLLAACLADGQLTYADVFARSP
jgi:LuxR family quorum-sensing system transcriptional regulator CciR